MDYLLTNHLYLLSIFRFRLVHGICTHKKYVECGLVCMFCLDFANKSQRYAPGDQNAPYNYIYPKIVKINKIA
jgi:hypothetical protein